MPFVYKITNMITGKAYIGKTMFSVERRWKEHCKDRLRPRCEKRPLYDAMNKYGVENFTVETLEECSSEEAADREMHWIQHFNTFKDGYNATLGGDSRHYLDYDIVMEVFCLTESVSIAAEILSIDTHSVRSILRLYGIPDTSPKERTYHGHAKRVSMFNLTGDYVRSFDSISAAADYLVQNNKTTSRNAAITCVSAVCCENTPKKTAYGYNWAFTIPEDYLNEDAYW